MHEANLGPQCSCDKCKREEKVFQRLGELEGLEWDTFDKLQAENAKLKRENEGLRKRVSHKKICYRVVHEFADWAKCDCGLDALLTVEEE